MGGGLEEVSGPRDKARLGIFPDGLVAIDGDYKHSCKFDFPVTKNGETYRFNLKNGDGVMYVEFKNGILSMDISREAYSDCDFRNFRKVVD